MKNEKYDHIGTGYNLTRKADPYLSQRLYHYLDPKPDETYVDLGCGTGNYTSALYKKGIQIIGIDPSLEMLSKAKLNQPNIEWKRGKAESIPLENESVNGCLAFLTTHHWSNLSKGFNEVSRVLKIEGKFIIFTSTPKQMEGYWLNHYFPMMLEDSIQQMVSIKTLTQHLSDRGFKTIQTESYDIKNNLKDLFLYAGKNNPELYLNEQIRHGIFSFSDLAHKEEVKSGLLKLSQDIKSGVINSSIENYKNKEGDYVFCIVEK